MKEPTLDQQYPFIRAWGKMMRSYDVYIKAQQQMARDENAPWDAIFMSHEGKWHTFGGISNPNTKTEVMNIAAAYGVAFDADGVHHKPE